MLNYVLFERKSGLKVLLLCLLTIFGAFCIPTALNVNFTPFPSFLPVGLQHRLPKTPLEMTRKKKCEISIWASPKRIVSLVPVCWDNVWVIRKTALVTRFEKEGPRREQHDSTMFKNAGFEKNRQTTDYLLNV